MKLIAGAILMNAAAIFMVAGEDEMAFFTALFSMGFGLWGIASELSRPGNQQKPPRE